MTKHIFRIFSCLTMLCVCIAGHAQDASQQTTLTISGNDAKLVLAADKLQSIYDIPMSFENAPIPAGDRYLTDEHKAIITFSYQLPPKGASFEARKALAAQALSNAIENYGKVRNREGWYSVVDTAEGLDIIQRLHQNDAHQIENYTPLLDTRITMPEQKESLYKALQGIAKAVSDLTGKRVAVMTVPQPMARQCSVTVEAENEAARDIIDRILNECPLGYFTPITKMPDASDMPPPPGQAYLAWRFYTDTSDAKLFDAGLNVLVAQPEGTAVSFDPRSHN